MLQRIMIIVILWCSIGVGAQEDEGFMGKYLAQAKQIYEKQKSYSDKKLLAAIKVAIGEVSKAGDLAGVTELQKIRERFEEAGFIKRPEVKLLRRAYEDWVGEVSHAKKILMDVYDLAIKRYTQRKMYVQARALDREKALLKLGVLPGRVVVPEGCVVYYQFNASDKMVKDEVEMVADLSGHEHHLKLFGGKIVKDGVDGERIYFDGKEAVGVIGGNARYENYTVVMWFKTKMQDRAALLSNGKDAKTNLWGKPSVLVNVKGQLQYTGGYVERKYRYLTSEQVVNDGRWHCVAVVVRGGDAGEVKMYLDGKVVEGEGAVAQVLVLSGGESKEDRVELGGRSVRKMFYEGYIDELMVFNKALGEAEVVKYFEKFEGVNPK